MLHCMKTSTDVKDWQEKEMVKPCSHVATPNSFLIRSDKVLVQQHMEILNGNTFGLKFRMNGFHTRMCIHTRGERSGSVHTHPWFHTHSG